VLGGELMKKRKFGNTGLETSVLGFGGFHLLEIPSREAEYLLNTYLDAGGNYIETAAAYGDGESELKIGQVVKHRRRDCILATKTGERYKEGASRSIDRSLKNLNTDYVDLLIMHAVATMEELNMILGPNGAMEAALKAKAEGKVGNIGISMHGQPDVLIEGIKQYPFDAVMTTINYYDRFNFPEIESELVPLANDRGTAVILMKPLADGLLWKNPEVAFRYALSIPVSVVVTGINTREMLQKDINYVNNLSPLTESEKEELYIKDEELGAYVCRQCGKCLPCPEGINIPEIFKYEGYYDRQMRDGIVRNSAEFALRDRLRFWFGNSELAKDKYSKLEVKAHQCTSCGDCIPRCPYKIDIINKLKLTEYKLTGKNIF
jgi:uncharacterized protein